MKYVSIWLPGMIKKHMGEPEHQMNLFELDITPNILQEWMLFQILHEIQIYANQNF